MGGFNELLSFVRTMSCGAFSVLSWLGFRRVIWLIYLASLSRIGAQSTGSISEYYATDPLQLLFGKFRDWDNIRLIHFIIFSLALFAVIGIYMPVLGFRAQKWKRLSQKIPNTDWIQHEALETLLTVQAFNQIEEKVKRVKRQILLPEDQGEGNKAWSKWPQRNLQLSLDNKTLEHINFNKVVAESYRLIERLVVRRLPYLKSSRDRTVRDYMLKVKTEFQLTDMEVTSYLGLYEQARFGGGRRLKNAHAHSPNRQNERRDSIHFHETRDYIDKESFNNFLGLLYGIMEKIRVGYRTQANSRGGNIRRSLTLHRRASSDRVTRGSTQRESFGK